MGKFEISGFKKDLRVLTLDLGNEATFEKKRQTVTDFRYAWDNGRVILVWSTQEFFLVSEDTPEAQVILESKEIKKLLGIIFKELYGKEAQEYEVHQDYGFITWEIK